VKRSPAARPAIVSSCPKYSITPSAFQSAIPEFTTTKGMPAAIAAWTAGVITTGSARVTAMPATFALTAARTRLAWAAASGS
jgi:hypothetical protein